MSKSIVTTILIFAFCGTVWAGLEITIDGNFDDWEDVPVLVEDPQDVQEPNGDYKSIRVVAFDGVFYAMETVYGIAAPLPPDAQRYYYHLIIDTDNDPNTGFSNAEYEGNDTGVKDPIGVDLFIQIGRRDGASDGVYVYFMDAGANEQAVVENFEWLQDGDSLELAVPFEAFDGTDFEDQFVDGQTMKISAFQEGSANSWECDWMESAEYTLGDTFPVEAKGKLAVRWADLKKIR